MCDASDYAVGTVLGQWKGRMFHTIYYASKVLNDAQINYATTEKELLAIVFALEKFWSYLVGSKVVIYIEILILGTDVVQDVTTSRFRTCSFYVSV